MGWYLSRCFIFIIRKVVKGMNLSSFGSVIGQPITLLGVTVNPLSIPQLNALVAEAITQRKRWVIAHHNLHSTYIYHRDPKMRAFYSKANYTHIDGMALVLLGNSLGFSLQREQRVTYADWLNPLMAEAAQKSWRVFYLGSKPGVAEKGASILREKFLGLQIATRDGYFDAQPDSQENQAVLQAIRHYQPNLLLVGMSMPRQEYWVSDNLEQIAANVVLTSGAAIDYIAGVVPTPPRWSGKLGLEWFFRLIAEPKRLWKRYLLEPWFILTLFLAEYTQLLFRRHQK